MQLRNSRDVDHHEEYVSYPGINPSRCLPCRGQENGGVEMSPSSGLMYSFQACVGPHARTPKSLWQGRGLGAALRGTWGRGRGLALSTRGSVIQLFCEYREVLGQGQITTQETAGSLELSQAMCGHLVQVLGPPVWGCPVAMREMVSPPRNLLQVLLLSAEKAK